MTDRRPLSLSAFCEPASGTPVPAQAGGHRLMPVEQGADFRQPPGETEAPGSLTFSDPDRLSEYHHGLHPAQDQLTT
ncbi:hypothetical protein [Streptomyces xanthochromogenes]|uniref:Uncharacterized protein n=1 Tax=Streptomyces xanthochromogenes TaxID=67384 RepID=A0ABQ3B1L4_9ACTN|nr:hypothetical protein [Streptomyces xanthochromogenes]GGY71895.1 hypothetical protein GCM10010326_77630 [Streptomyces xanthochromogenes]